MDLSGNFFDPISLPISVAPLQYFELRRLNVPGTDGYINFQVRKNVTSVLGPIVNAFELYSVQGVVSGTDATQGWANFLTASVGSRFHSLLSKSCACNQLLA